MARGGHIYFERLACFYKQTTFDGRHRLQKHHPLDRHTGGLVVGVTSVFENSSGNITTVVVGFVVLVSLDPCGTTFQG